MYCAVMLVNMAHDTARWFAISENASRIRKVFPTCVRQHRMIAVIASSGDKAFF